MSRFDLLALLLVTTAVAALINKRLLRQQPAIGLLVVSLFISGGIILMARVFGATAIATFTQAVLGLADLPHVLLDGALGFLLFAAALQVDVEEVRRRIGTVLALSSAGVLLATMFYGTAMWEVFRLAGTRVPLGWCVVLGASSVALALSLPPSPYRDALLGVCYGVVVFTILGQGLTMPWLIRGWFGDE
jgi:monovalent cation:H+ antiporter, CPA1 family